MLRVPILLASLVLSVWTLTMEAPAPGDLALVLSEEEFEDYLDAWLAIEELKSFNAFTKVNFREGGCTFRVNGDLGQPQPVYLHNGDFIVPTGTTGSIHLSNGEKVIIACTGSNRRITHSNILQTTLQTATVTCVNNNIVSSEWLSGDSEFLGLTCTTNSQFTSQATGETCYNGNTVIRSGFTVEGEFYPVFHSCFDQNRLEVLYSWYQQNPPNAVHQSSVTRPGWLASTFFPGISGGINSRYTQVQQKASIAELIGSNELAEKYVTSSQYLARGHLAAKTDFVLATGQRATFFFTNAAPQWQPFNAGNWNWVEQNLRARVGAAGYNTVVYTGTFGVSQLRDVNGELVDIFLHRDANNNPQLPVPLYFYKVVYDESLQIGTVFVSINNPYYTEEEVRALTFCTDRCRNNPDFSWLRWQPDRIDIGYSFCCEVDDFRRTVPHLPDFGPVKGLLF